MMSETGIVAFEVTAPMIAFTRYWFTRRFATFAASVASFLSSWMTYVIFIPATPPFAFASSTAIRKEFRTDSPYVFTSPESGVIKPIFISFAWEGTMATIVGKRKARTRVARFIVPPFLRRGDGSREESAPRGAILPEEPPSVGHPLPGRAGGASRFI